MNLLEVCVKYPDIEGEMVLRTSDDWDLDVGPTEVNEDRTSWTFVLPCRSPYLYFKPCLRLFGEHLWSVGSNYILTRSEQRKTVYPRFYYEGGTLSREPEIYHSERNQRSYRIRVYHPAGYHENYFEHFPLLLMHDAHNLFFPEEAFTGRTWELSTTLEVMDRMNSVRPCIVVGIYPEDRMEEYTNPGYYDYGHFIVDELMPALYEELRALKGPENTAVMGSSLGGLVSFHLAWRWPEVFGYAGCLSSTFHYQDDLTQDIARGKRSKAKFYLDSGWPGDNYEVTRSVCDLMLKRGFEWGKDLLYFSFPGAGHSEADWAARCHLPLQFFFQQRPDFRKKTGG